MKLSSKGRYGVQAVFDIAFHNKGKAAQIKDIAERQGIPARFLEQVFQDLKKAGLVRSKRGPKGGYELAHAPTEISLGDIVRALEGPVAVSGAERRQGGVSSQGTGHLVVETVLKELFERIESCFDNVTIADLCGRGEALDVQRSPDAGYVYAI